MFQKIIEFIFGKIVIIQNDFFGDMVNVGSCYEFRKMFKLTGKIVEIELEIKSIHVDG